MTKKYLANIPHELDLLLESAIADGEKITKDFVREEAKYLLSCYQESGHVLNESLYHGEPEERAEAKSELIALKIYIKSLGKTAKKKEVNKNGGI